MFYEWCESGNLNAHQKLSRDVNLKDIDLELIAAATMHYVDDPEMGWGQRSQGGVEIHEIEFDHDELLREPYVRPVGEQLAACVKRLGKRPGEFEFWPLEASVISSSSS